MFGDIYFKKQMKRIVRLTEQDLVRLVKRVINEDDDKSKLIVFLTSMDIDNVELGLILYDSQDIKVNKNILYTARIRVLEKFLKKLEDDEVIKFAEKLGIDDWNQGHGNFHYRGSLWRFGISAKIINREHWDKIKDEVLYS